jgi:eukaryotic-like serine/threonine-protein kinase
MRARQNPTLALLGLGSAETAEQQRASWRQALTALGELGRVDGPPPLDGLSVPQLVRAVQIALETGLVDDVDWATPERAAVALYEMTSAMPAGRERTALGRRAFSRLYSGNAATFAAVATRMAINSGKPLETPALQARVHLLYSLPVGSVTNGDALALTLVARGELFERWVAEPAGGTLPARRMAAIILERAAREVVRSTQLGDPGPLARFADPSVQTSYKTLLADREPLVWRHAAVARGLLSAVEPRLREEIDLELDVSLSPTEWRRAVVSLVACLVQDRNTAMQQCKSLLRSELFERHPPILSTMIWGLAPAIEAEPELARELIDFLSWVDRTDVAQEMATLLSDVHNPSFGLSGAQRMRNSIAERLWQSDSDTLVVLDSVTRELAPDRRDAGSILTAVRTALVSFESTGAEAAHELARVALGRAYTALDRLEGEGARLSPTETYRLLSELDRGAIESSRLYNLLLLDRRPGDTNASVVEMERLYDRFGSWFLAQEAALGSTPSSDGVVPRQKWLALLHLVDVETSIRSGSEHAEARVAWRIRRSIRTLLDRLTSDGLSALHRVFCATLARTFDAAVREGVADVSDLLLLCFQALQNALSVGAIVDASTTPELRRVLGAYADFLDRAPVSEASVATFAHLTSSLTPHFVKLAGGIPLACSYRGEALRQTLLRLGQSVEHLETTRSLSQLLDAEGNGIADLEQACLDLSQLMRSATLRVLGETMSAGGGEAKSLTRLIEVAVGAEQRPASAALAGSIQGLCSGVPLALAEPLRSKLARLGTLPVEAPTDVASARPQGQPTPLPDWLLPRRTIGSFYVVRSLGAGGASSVFVARRIEARHQQNAELYALKIPKYDATVARSLSEQEFLDMFRQEAGALLALPRHPNLARFVSFDAEARPKPILVMELIGGNSLERMIRRNLLTIGTAFAYLDGVLAGLETMHSAGVGHLDVKPANVILRDELTAVLVDFGLSGRHIRPGCGTLEYCAPEVLGVVPNGYDTRPANTDIYAFACMAFETLTSRYLIDGRDETAVIAQHVEHDGWPRRLAEFARVDGVRELAMLLARCLRRDPKIRPSVRELRRALALPAHALGSRPWPLPMSRREYPPTSEAPIPLVANRR